MKVISLLNALFVADGSRDVVGGVLVTGNQLPKGYGPHVSGLQSKSRSRFSLTPEEFGVPEMGPPRDVSQ